MGWEQIPLVAILSLSVLIFRYHFLMKINGEYLSDSIDTLVKGIPPGFSWKYGHCNWLCKKILSKSCDKTRAGEWEGA